MARSVNKVILLGNLGKDAETKFTPGGVSVTNFSIATTRSWKDGDEWKEQTEWSNVVAWRKEKLANYLTKGTQVYVEGRLQTRSYETKSGERKYITEVVADEVILCGGRSGAQRDDDGGRSHDSGGPVSMPRSARQRQQQDAPVEHSAVTDDDVPF